MICRCILPFMIAISCFRLGLNSVESSWESMPVFPAFDVIANARKEYSTNCSNRKIPCLIWITSKLVSPRDIPPHIKSFIERNKKWNVNLIDDNSLHRFMYSIFNGTKILWAFDMINPKIGAARVDIWRIALLWVFGGVYLDLDADLLTPLDQVIIVSYLLFTKT